MRARLAPTVAALFAVAAVAACGGDGNDDGGPDRSPQEALADRIVSEVELEDGMSMDEDCIRRIIARLSDGDAQEVLDAGPDGDPAITPAGDATLVELFGCFDGIELGLDGQMSG